MIKVTILVFRERRLHFTCCGKPHEEFDRLTQDGWGSEWGGGMGKAILAAKWEKWGKDGTRGSFVSGDTDPLKIKRKVKIYKNICNL